MSLPLLYVPYFAIICVAQQVELERKTKQNSEMEFESKIEQKQHEIYSIEHKIKNLNRERDIMAGDAEDRVKLSLKKTELENLRKKHKKM